MRDCFPNKGIGVRQNYPYFDAKSGKVITLEVAINQCREANGEKPFNYKKADMAAVNAYMAFTSRGKPMNIKIPDDPRALAAYKKGEEYFYTRRGQQNFSCASCHVQNAGNHIRTEVLAPALGIIERPCRSIARTGAAWAPVSRRITSCNSQVPSNAAQAEGRTLSRRRILPFLHGQRPADLRAGRAPVTGRQAHCNIASA